MDQPNSAASMGARDVFVFRRVSGGRFVHVGGVGRGEGWAGIVEIHLDEEPRAMEAVQSAKPVRLEGAAPLSVFGPYYARAAAFVPLSADLLVVFGNPVGPLADLSDDELAAEAEAVARQTETVSPAKRLADELELLHAVQELVNVKPGTLDEAMAHVVRAAAGALSCEVGVLAMLGENRVAVTGADRLSDADADADADGIDVADVLRSLPPALSAPPVCIQDAATLPLPAPFRPADGVRSYYLVGVGSPAMALLLLVHTDANPRGFTLLCREMGLRLAESAEALLRAAKTREELEVEIDRLSLEARTDALTGVANRLAWDEAVDGAVEGGPAGVIVVDVDRLKWVNDNRGHEAGDRLLQATADILRNAVRSHDLVARLGGDEFAVLLPEADDAACREVVERIASMVAAQRCHGSPLLSVAVGYSMCTTPGCLRDALRQADAEMYRYKRMRRTAAAR